VLRVSWVSLVGHKDLENRSMLTIHDALPSYFVSNFYMMLFLVILYLISTVCNLISMGLVHLN
jgi:hypothetical protein